MTCFLHVLKLRSQNQGANDKMARLQCDAACRGCLCWFLALHAPVITLSAAAQVAGVINTGNRRKLGSISMEILSISRAGQNWCSMNHIIHSIVASFPTALFRVVLHQCIFIGFTACCRARKIGLTYYDLRMCHGKIHSRQRTRKLCRELSRRDMKCCYCSHLPCPKSRPQINCQYVICFS